MTTIDASLRALEIQGSTVPKLGFGTWEILGRDCEEAVADALEIGYRHIDTAQAYDNEAEVGKALAAVGVPRQELWLTTKLWRERVRRPTRVRASAEGSLERLQVDCVDLLLLHWPNDDVPLEETLGALAELREEGLIKHFGVSNFPADMLREALKLAPIFADQVEFHPFLGQDELVDARGGEGLHGHRLLPARPRQGARTTRRCARSASATARPPARSRCAGCSTSRTSRRSRRPRATSAGSRTSRSSTSSSATRTAPTIDALPKDERLHRPALGARLGRLEAASGSGGLRSGLAFTQIKPQPRAAPARRRSIVPAVEPEPPEASRRRSRGPRRRPATGAEPRRDAGGRERAASAASRRTA